MYLLNCLFFKLFLHWSYSVRTIFHHLLYVRIYQFAHRPLQQINAKEQEMLAANPHYVPCFPFREKKWFIDTRRSLPLSKTQARFKASRTELANRG